MQLKDTNLFRQQAYIDGAWQDADGGQTIKVNNPASNEILGTVPKMGAAETRRAVSRWGCHCGHCESRDHWPRRCRIPDILFAGRARPTTTPCGRSWVP